MCMLNAPNAPMHVQWHLHLVRTVHEQAFAHETLTDTWSIKLVPDRAQVKQMNRCQIVLRQGRLIIEDSLRDLPRIAWTGLSR